ncbi:MAG: hypothetical protein GY805_12045 [Chloroflexi bacterium]|nr:hypothetical protein [Chloroflexota bacterium]
MGGQTRHLQADDLPVLVVHGGAWAEDAVRQAGLPIVAKPVPQFDLLGWAGVMVQFYGRIAQAENHSLTTGLD